MLSYYKTTDFDVEEVIKWSDRLSVTFCLSEFTVYGVIRYVGTWDLITGFHQIDQTPDNIRQQHIFLFYFTG